MSILKIVYGCCLLMIIGCSDESSRTIAEKQNSEKAHDLEGVWFHENIKVIFSEGAIEATENGRILVYPAGDYHLVGEKRGRLTLQGGEVESFLYELKGSALTLTFERSGPITLAREK
jgi:hypothetical protein